MATAGLLRKSANTLRRDFLAVAKKIGY